THGDYPAAVIALAEQLEVPLLDLHARTRELIESLGETASRRLFTQLPAGASPLYPEGIEDNTHFSIEGAITIAEIVRSEERRVGKERGTRWMHAWKHREIDKM